LIPVKELIKINKILILFISNVCHKVKDQEILYRCQLEKQWHYIASKGNDSIHD